MSNPLRQKTTCINSGWGKEKYSVRLRTAARHPYLDDPDYGFGIVGAVTSGKASALALRDRRGTQVLFGRMGHGIPGNPRGWMEEFTRDGSPSF